MKLSLALAAGSALLGSALAADLPSIETKVRLFLHCVSRLVVTGTMELTGLVWIGIEILLFQQWHRIVSMLSVTVRKMYKANLFLQLHPWCRLSTYVVD